MWCDVKENFSEITENLFPKNAAEAKLIENLKFRLIDRLLFGSYCEWWSQAAEMQISCDLIKVHPAWGRNGKYWVCLVIWAEISPISFQVSFKVDLQFRIMLYINIHFKWNVFDQSQ